ncbi:MAG: flagellar protein FlaG [Clostridiaceae bacterium BRH_c20a]|nr:MAG: flagellar protein FlaG [Clostridiaceae bacterium BRH_c20a]
MRVEGVSQTVPVKRVEPVGKQIGNSDANIKNNTNKGQNSEQQRNSEEEIISAIESANKHFEIYDKRLEFSIHEKTKEIMVKIIDSNTDEVIKEIPSQKILDMIANMMELAGLLVDEKV